MALEGVAGNSTKERAQLSVGISKSRAWNQRQFSAGFGGPRV